MKTTLKEYIKDPRNLFHVLIGVTVGYDIGLLFNRKNFPISWEYWNNALYPIVCFVALFGASFFWERQQDKIRKNSSDMRDVWVSAFSGLIGGYISMIYASWYIVIPFTLISAVVAVKYFKK